MDPPCHGAAPEQRCWNEHQLRDFLNVAIEHRLGPPIRLATMTGMRRGEALGLRWSDIDLDTATLSIRRSVSCTGYHVHTTPTKARTWASSVALFSSAVAGGVALSHVLEVPRSTNSTNAPWRPFDGTSLEPVALVTAVALTVLLWGDETVFLVVGCCGRVHGRDRSGVPHLGGTCEPNDRRMGSHNSARSA